MPNSDEEIAAEYRQKLSSALAVVCGIVEMAKERGFLLGYRTGDDPTTGKQKVIEITVSKKM